MITRNTVFVVGAGASVPFLFPTGRQLLRERKDQNADVLRGLAGTAISEADALSLHAALRGSEDNSIDALLEYRPDLERAGKLVIASILLGKELSCVDTTVCENDWIQHLLSLMTEGARSAEEFSVNNKVTFVTYNYDRLIEYKMTSHLRAKWQAQDDMLLECLQRIPVIHLHGSLGTLMPGVNHVPFGALIRARLPTHDVDPRTDLIVRSSESIRIVHEVKDDDPQFGPARTALQNAAVVFFLGFGFGPDNVRRLDLSNISDLASVYATRTLMTNQEFDRYCVLPMKYAGREQRLAPYADVDKTWDCLRLLTERAMALN